MEPPPSLPWATGTIPDATAAAEPPDEPPLVCSVLHGLRGRPERERLGGDRRPELRGVRATEHDEARSLEPLHEEAVPEGPVTSRLCERGPFAVGLPRLGSAEVLQQDGHAPERCIGQLRGGQLDERWRTGDG